MTERRPPDVGDDFYEALQVSPTADIEIIEAAYRVLARRYHPDLNRSPGATERMAQINAAWDVLRDPERRAAYDTRRRQPRRSRPITVEPAEAPMGAPVERAGPAPELFVEPQQLSATLRRGARRTFTVSAYTEPPGIRVEAGVTHGSSWLHVQPEVLKGLVKEDLTVSLQTHDLPPGRHTGAVAIVTSWETRALPVDLQLRPAPLLYRIGTVLRYGPSGQGSTLPLLLGLVLLVAIVGGLAYLAVAR